MSVSDEDNHQNKTIADKASDKELINSDARVYVVSLLTMAILTSCVALAVVLLGMANAQDLEELPPGLLFGTATASYQIEGAWNVNGKGENIWDRFTHSRPETIVDGSNGDVAADSYNNFREDVRILKDMGMQVYRFSIAWSRILPTGESNFVNQDGINYYNNLINELLANEIQPFVNMYHLDLPQPLQEVGGWTNEVLVNLFEDYARILYTNFGDRVKWWTTFNEPSQTTEGYSEGVTAPGLTMSGVGDYLAAHTLLKSHARAWHLYDNEFRAEQQGKVSITLNSGWSEPETSSADDQTASTNSMQFHLGWFAHPIFSAEGDYPAVMKERVAANSLAEGRPRSRLPEFTPEEILYIKGTGDFFGLNHYTTELCTLGVGGQDPSHSRDTGVVCHQDPAWPGSAASWLKVVPWGFRKCLQWIQMEYNNPQVYVTENGFSDLGELNDTGRIDYFVSYLREMLLAYYVDGVDVIGYAAWSLIDNFEWTKGYTEKFGVYYVDFNDPARPRTPKASSFVLAEIIRTRRIPPETTKNIDANEVSN